MTEEMIKNITDAEEKASEMKRLATEQATRKIAEAETQATRLKQTSAQACKSYRETQLKTAVADAEKEYQKAMKKKEEDAKAYCEKVLENAEDCVREIVGRIVGGSC